MVNPIANKPFCQGDYQHRNFGNDTKVIANSWKLLRIVERLSLFCNIKTPFGYPMEYMIMMKYEYINRSFTMSF